MIDGCIDDKIMNLINFMVNNLGVTTFMKSCDVSEVNKIVEKVKLFAKIVNEIEKKVKCRLQV